MEQEQNQEKRMVTITPSPPPKMGRPNFEFTEELAESILLQIAETTDGLRKVCKDNGIAVSTFQKWLNNEDFAARYARAYELKAILMADEIIEIADEDLQQNEKGGDMAHATDKKNRVEARKWLMARMHRKMFGDKQVVDIPQMEGKVLTDNQFDTLLGKIIPTSGGNENIEDAEIIE